MHHFYIFLCKDNTLYCGSAKDLKARERLHNLGKGAKYTRSRGGGKMVYSEKFRTIGKALKREAEVKRWSRLEKLELINPSTLSLLSKSYIRPTNSAANSKNNLVNIDKGARIKSPKIKKKPKV